jgi:2-(1,2-epoxy-1,2-dihydrophenyl)acetyl-CoA isomerase
MSPLVIHTRDGPISILTINRPERHNSLIPPLLDQLLTALEENRSDSEVCSLVLRANGPSFSTGGDIRAFYENLHDIENYSNRIVGLLNRVILSMLTHPTPIVTAVHGLVTGGSIGIVLASDVVLVTTGASFTPYYNQVGFSPDGGWTALLPFIIGPKRVSSILSQNKTISAEQSVSWGLADRCVSPELLNEEAIKVSMELASYSCASNASSKHLLFETYNDLEQRLETERSAFLRQIVTEEAKLGMEFYLKRKRLP